MTSKRRFWPTVISALALMLLTGIAPCGAKGTSSPSTLARIAQSGVIHLGYQDDAFPLSYLQDGNPTGYAIDICQELVESVKRELKLKTLKVSWVPSGTASQFVLINQQAADIMCIPAFYSKNRQRTAVFSTPLFFSATAFLSRTQSGKDTLESLTGHSVIVKSGTIYVGQLHKINTNNQLNLNIDLETNNNDAFHSIEEGEYAAIFSSTVLLRGMQARAAHPEEYHLSDDRLSPPVPAGLLLPLNDPAFVTFVDRALNTLLASKKFTAIYQKWFLSPIPPDAINLNLPMSNKLKELTQLKTNSIYHYE